MLGPRSGTCLRHTRDRVAGERQSVIGMRRTWHPASRRVRLSGFVAHVAFVSICTLLALLSMPALASADPVADNIASIVSEMTVALDRHRQASLLAPVAVEWSDGAQLHATYLTQNSGRPERAGLLIHS